MKKRKNLLRVIILHFIGQSDDIKRHLNMLHYAKDPFEKNHGPRRKCFENKPEREYNVSGALVQFMKYD